MGGPECSDAVFSAEVRPTMTSALDSLGCRVLLNAIAEVQASYWRTTVAPKHTKLTLVVFLCPCARKCCCLFRFGFLPLTVAGANKLTGNSICSHVLQWCSLYSAAKDDPAKNDFPTDCHRRKRHTGICKSCFSSVVFTNCISNCKFSQSLPQNDARYLAALRSRRGHGKNHSRII